MSWYVSYYLGYKKDGKIYPLGPYDCNNKLHSFIYRSRSFASDLYKRFYPVSDDAITDELRKEFEYEDWNGEKAIDVKYLELSDLPRGDFIRSGYFLIDDIEQYQREKDTYDLFYDHLDSATYAMKMESELKFGVPKPKKDDNGWEIEQHSCGEYAFFSYPDYSSEAYEAFLIRYMVEAFEYFDGKLKDDAEIVILETEG